MKQNQTQKLNVYVHREQKLAHIGVYNMYLPSGKLNYSSKLSAEITTARRLENLAEQHARPGLDIKFGNSLTVRLMNTNYTGWEEIEIATDLSLNDAQSIAKKQALHYELLGYSITGSLGNKCVRNTGDGLGSQANILIKDATQRRLYDIVSKLVVGINNIDLNKIQRDIYKQYNYHGLDTRRKFWVYIQDNMKKYESETA